jgi:hypothetical protein
VRELWPGIVIGIVAALAWIVIMYLEGWDWTQCGGMLCR